MLLAGTKIIQDFIITVWPSVAFVTLVMKLKLYDRKELTFII